ncbi:MAG: phosphonoacetaldehyde reductase [Planctomycetaceae bacterium]|nr:phosphonoacetaldehyde reductase [Planctomycetaceae bacterium]
MIVKQQYLIDSLHSVVSVLESLELERLFVVLDTEAYEVSGARTVLETVLQKHATTRFTNFELNPKLEDVQRGVDLYRPFNPDFVIALGGGTAIDLAKLISGLAAQQDSSRDIALGLAPIQASARPLMAIPTTAGTGSEATHFAVVYVDGEKYSVAHPTLRPDYAVVDPALTASLPPRITAATGLDAFCQAIESVWAVAANEESMGYATEAAQLAFRYLEAATNAPTPEARRAMCRASHLAGKAINITKTTAPHALSYSLTSRFGVPHGFAVATTLAPLLKFNAGVTDEDCTDPRGAAAVRERIAQILKALGAETVEEACSSILSLLTRVGCPKLEEIVNHNTGLITVIESANVQRLSNNPRRASREQLIDVLSQSRIPF